MHTQQPHKRPTTALAFAMTAAVAATTLNGKPQSQPKRNERKRKVRNERKKPWLLVFDWLNYGNNYNSTFQWVFSTPPAVVSSFVACFYSGYLIFIYLFGSFFFSFYVFLFFHRFVFLGIFFSFAACALSGTLIIPSLLDEMALMIVIMGGFRFFSFVLKKLLHRQWMCQKWPLSVQNSLPIGAKTSYGGRWLLFALRNCIERFFFFRFSRWKFSRVFHSIFGQITTWTKSKSTEEKKRAHTLT